MTENKIIEPTIFTNNKLLIQQLMSFKYFYIVLTFCFIVVAYVYNKIATAEYEVYASVMATRNETSSLLSSNDLFNGMQRIQAYNDIEDGISKLRSFSMIYSTIIKLNFEIGYFGEKVGLIKNKSGLYRNIPFIVSIRKSHVQPINTEFYIDVLSDSTFRIYADETDAILFNYVGNTVIAENFPITLNKLCRFNEDINLDYLSLLITHNPEFKPNETGQKYNYYFELYNPDVMAKEYGKKLNIYRASPSSSILNISFRSENLDKSIIFMNSYLNFYFEESLARKNAIANNTINFIDNQISGISDSLIRSESEITSYRSANQVMNLSYQGQSTYDNLQQLYRERDNLQAQERYFGYILEYLKTTQDVAGIVPPSAMNVENPVMNQLITELLTLTADRSNILSFRGEKNIYLPEIENRIKVQKQYITEIATSNLNSVKQTIADLNYRASKLSNEISSLPRRELNMGNIQRQFNIDDAIYTYLLQKRSEATITMASNYPDFTMFEPARKVTSSQVAPKILFNYLVALMLGMVIPTAIMLLKNLLNFKISNTEYIHQLVGRPPIATIYTLSAKAENVLVNNPASVSSEAFRALRSIIFRKLAPLKSKVILITSAQPQEGKSFISYNLATAIALVGKKTIIIDADLKRPALHKKFNLENKTGISNFMIDNLSLEEILLNTKVENLSFISAGHNLPNATEVIESGGLDTLIETVKERFEYIIIDTSPIGFMADALLMTRYANLILLVVRNNSTFKESFTNVITTLNSNNINNYEVVFNDKDMMESSYGRYSKYYVKGKKTAKRNVSKL